MFIQLFQRRFFVLRITYYFIFFYTALNCNFNTMTLITDIGREIARDMASKGARVIMACKNVSKGM